MRRSYLLLLCAMLLTACSHDSAPDSIASPSDSSRPVRLPLVAESELNAVAGDKNTGSVAAGEDFVIAGTFRVSQDLGERPPVVTVKVTRKTADGKSIILDSKSAKPAKKNDGAYSFRGDVTAPKLPGQYYIQAHFKKESLGEKQITAK